MAQHLLDRYTLDTGAGAQPLNRPLAKLDLSQADSITLRATITKAAEDAADTLNIRLQESWDGGVTWHTRIRLAEFTGDMSPSTSAPEVREGVAQQFGALADAEEALEPSGSAGGTDLSAGTVRNGHFAPAYRVGGVRAATHRLQVVVVDGDSDGDFEGTIEVFYNTVP
jgi:hypothetical protein